ncbi:MAG: Crp/Fnr family transcriptional regulator [Crocinitomicaceae bacterium]
MSKFEDFIKFLDENDIWEDSKTVVRHEFIKQEGQQDTNIYFIVEGCLRLFILDDEYEHTIRFGYQNNIVTALDSYISEQPSDLCIQAIRKTTVKIISKRKFRSLVDQSTELKNVWTELLELLVYQQLEREKDILIQSPVKRYKRVLARSPQLFQEVPHKYIASYLRMTPETLSRLKE